ncbi:MAG TPA: M81 family metallopeptidase [Flavitalea sp.]|nr:M81 family metallopeptidase [Flavitalea sp.]
MAKRVALLGIQHESNTFIDRRTTLGDFLNGHWLMGEDIRKEYKHAHHEIGGMIESLDEKGIETVCVMYAEATPGGIIESEAFDHLLRVMMTELEKALPVDGCLVVPHGAAVSEDFPDMDGRWLSALRERLGGDTPIVGTLDPHANVSELMAVSTNALIAYATNPHIDQRETGRKAADLLARMLDKEISPSQALIQTPVAIALEQQYTSAYPCNVLYRLAAQTAGLEGILSVSVLLGFPYADVREMGSAFIVIADNAPELAIEEGEKLKAALIRLREDCSGKKTAIGEILPSLAEIQRPALLLDMGDNIGGGAPGDSVYLLQAIESFGKYKCCMIVFDPDAVAIAAAHTINDQFELAFGNVSAEPGGDKYVSRVRLLKKADGKFSELTAKHGGQVNYDMGSIVIVETDKGNVVMLGSLRVPPFSLQQLLAFGIDPAAFDVMVAKGVNAPIAAYAPACPTIIQVNTPGVTQADMTLFNYSNRRRPLHPFENIL